MGRPKKTDDEKKKFKPITLYTSIADKKERFHALAKKSPLSSEDLIDIITTELERSVEGK